MIELKNVLEQHPNCLDSRSSFKSLLMDKYPSEKRTVNILTILYECGIASSIRSKKILSSADIHTYITQIENDYGISGEYTQDAILIWAAAFGSTAAPVSLDTAHSPSQSSSTFKESKQIVYVEGNVADYTIVQKTDGYYISHFNGFEEPEMTIPSLIDGKRIIGVAEDAFRGCVSVEKINLSDGIEIIENRAFAKCSALRQVCFPQTLRIIGSDQAKKFGDGAFACTGLEELIIPDSVVFIGPSSFEFCRKLSRVQLPRYLKEISVELFSRCETLSEVVFPQNLKVIRTDAFKDCRMLEAVHIPIGTETIDVGAFHGCWLDAIYVPPSVKHIGEHDSSLFHSYRAFDSEWSKETLGSLGVADWGGHPTIYCTAGSAAMEFARKNNIKCAKATF